MLETILLIVTGTMTALVAGLFFSFSVAVNGGLHALKDSEYVRAMHSINRIILNPFFLLSFMLPVGLLPLVTFSYGDGFGSSTFLLLAAASMTYIVGTYGVTMGGNVPLNKELDQVKVASASEQEFSQARTRFEQPWNRLNSVRTIGAIATVALFIAACLTM